MAQSKVPEFSHEKRMVNLSSSSSVNVYQRLDWFVASDRSESHAPDHMEDRFPNVHGFRRCHRGKGLMISSLNYLMIIGLDFGMFFGGTFTQKSMEKIHRFEKPCFPVDFPETTNPVILAPHREVISSASPRGHFHPGVPKLLAA